jgi:hypothetical protein
MAQSQEILVCVEEGFSRRVFLPDARGANRYLRVTWHKDTATVVFSHWQDDVCVSSTPVSLDDAANLIGLIVVALREAALIPIETATRTSPTGSLLYRLRERFRPQLAQVVKLHGRLRHDRSMRDIRGA